MPCFPSVPIPALCTPSSSVLLACSGFGQINHMLPWSAEAAQCFNFTTSWSPAPLFALWLWTKTVSVSYTVSCSFTLVLTRREALTGVLGTSSSSPSPIAFHYPANLERAPLSAGPSHPQSTPPSLYLLFGGDQLPTRHLTNSPLSGRALSENGVPIANLSTDVQAYPGFYMIF
jgi:hypothetical protein